jgi:CBS domain-containing protein
MGNANVTKLKGKKQTALYYHHLIQDVRALELMLEKGLFETDPMRIGAEQELFLVDAQYRPLSQAIAFLDQVKDPHFTTEIASYNLEINLDPVQLGPGCLDIMANQLRELLAKGQDAAARLGGRLLLTGILPTLKLTDAQLHNMTPFPRYLMLNEAAKRSKGQNFNIYIKGVDEIALEQESVMLESCNTSFQLHLQIPPDDFVKAFNWAQAIAGPVLSACVNSPLLFGKELWAETRIPLFTQSVDIRTNSHLINEGQARVSFENDWQRGSVTDIFRDSIVRFRSLVTAKEFDDSMDVLEKGGIPRLTALNLHNGTVYRWNRACYGIGNGKPHLRIENRYIPAGPTVIDEMANMAFWIGLMSSRDFSKPGIEASMDFNHANKNFYSAARHGMAAQLYWDDELYPAKSLLLDQFLPLAAAGLTKIGLDQPAASEYLEVIKRRIDSHTGAAWTAANYQMLKKKTNSYNALQQVTAVLDQMARANIPVADWPVADGMLSFPQKVIHLMQKDLFTVAENDSIELVYHVMKWKGIHHIPVVHEDRTLIGMVTWRDITVEDRLRWNPDVFVKNIMTTKLITVTEAHSADEAKALLDTYGFHSLPVVQNDKLVGIVTSNDFAHANS